MGLISGSIPALIGGVSQQDDSIRSTTQLSAALNCNLSPTRGNGKRASAEFISVLASDLDPEAHYHSIVRDAQERYIVAVSRSGVRVFDHETGYEYQVVMASGASAYLQTTDVPSRSITSTTVADYTFIVNTERTVAMADDLSPGMLMGSVQTFQDLPKDGIINALYAITGDPANGFDQYYVQRQSTNVWNEVGKPGIKFKLDKNTMPHGLKRIPDAVHADGFYFSFGPLDWDARACGDEDSNPEPSFVGQRIRSVLFHRERLGFLVGENVVLSEVGFPFNFWRTTITQLLDSDPIDIAVQAKSVADLRHGVSYLKALVLFDPNGQQYQLSGDPVLTPKTVKIDQSTSYESSPYVPPVMSGSSIFFINEAPGIEWATVREYFIQDDTVTPDAPEVTAHVSHYIPCRPRCMAASGSADAVFVGIRQPSGPQVYVHQFKWQGDEKAQSAWHEWQFSGVGAVAHMNVIGKYLYVVAEAPGGGCELLRVSLEDGSIMSEVSTKFDVCLDRRVVVTPSWQQFGNYTDITVPYVLTSLTDVLVLRTVDWGTPGAVLDLTGASLQNGGQTIRLPGNQASGRVVVGLRYTQRFTLSRQFVRDSRNYSVLIGRLQIRRMTVRFQDTGYFTVTVQPKARAEASVSVRPPLLSTYQGRVVGDADFTTNTPQVSSGSFTFLVQGQSDLVDVSFENDSPYPSWFQSVQWEGLYVSRSRV